MFGLVRWLGLALLLAVMLPTGAAKAQDRPSVDQALQLHAQARTRFQELHQRMQKLQAAKLVSDPDDSKLLQSGNRLVQERRIHEGMARAQSQIEAGDYDQAHESMREVQAALQALLELLLNREDSVSELMERIEQLEEFRDRVDEVLAQQEAEKADAAAAERLLEHLAALDRAQAEVAALLEAQSTLRAEANSAGLAAAAEKASAMAERESELAERSEQLAKDASAIEAEAKRLAEPGSDPAAKDPQADDPTGSDPTESAPSLTDPAATPPEQSSAAPAEAGKGSQSASKAASAMKAAQDQLQENQPERSLLDMDQAMRELEATQRELEKLSDEARRKLEQLPFDLQARKQEQTRVDTDKLAQDMESAEQGDEQKEGQPTPGKQNVQQAVPKQKTAAGQLKEHKPAGAKQDQQDAAESLEQAKQELEDALAQLRQQLEDEVLRVLEERFAEMLARQKEISARTKAIDQVRATSLAAGEAVPANVRSTCAELSLGEHELSGEANDALKLLEEDGRSPAFPMLVEELREDLTRVGDRLAEFQTAAVTQATQAEIEATLSDMLDALRRTIESREAGT